MGAYRVICVVVEENPLVYAWHVGVEVRLEKLLQQVAAAYFPQGCVVFYERETPGVRWRPVLTARTAVLLEEFATGHLFQVRRLRDRADRAGRVPGDGWSCPSCGVSFSREVTLKVHLKGLCAVEEGKAQKSKHEAALVLATLHLKL